ncbi:MAG: dimethyl sulfoxide reductase anchor subunit [Rubrivivax sp.]|nr:dimethyl sulfoxide reductase anchor subunit [Rubrivivax sp.]
MQPPLSMILFTVLAGAGQGLMVALAALEAAAAMGLGATLGLTRLLGGAVVLALAGAGLAAATLHLGHPLRAWRAVAMWRTSWLSREVIVLPAFMACVALWVLTGALPWALAAAALALVLYLCTGMIYAAVKAMREWAHPVTPLNFGLLGLASGFTLAAVLVPGRSAGLAAAALAATLLGAASRGWALWRNLNLSPKTTLQTAIGIRHPRIVQISQGAMGGTFNTREFFHRRDAGFVRGMRALAAVAGFGLPALLLAMGAALPLALASQLLGLLAERWCFFAEARHPQNLYHQGVA